MNPTVKGNTAIVFEAVQILAGLTATPHLRQALREQMQQIAELAGRISSLKQVIES